MHQDRIRTHGQYKLSKPLFKCKTQIFNDFIDRSLSYDIFIHDPLDSTKVDPLLHVRGNQKCQKKIL